jgi:hypothetical protein
VIRLRDAYTNIPVTLLKPEEQAFVEHYFNTHFLRGFTENPHLQTRRGDGLLYPNYGPLPRPRINELVIPTGATRWSYTVVACNTATKNEIYNRASLNSNRLLMEFGVHRLWNSELQIPEDAEGEYWPVSLIMMPLQPHPVTVNEIEEDRLESGTNDNPFGLWLIPFVDTRYLWQWQDTAGMDEALEGYTDPLSLMGYLWNRLRADGRTYATDAVATQHVATNYANVVPNPIGNNYENAAVVMDHVCWHLGLTIVPDLQYIKANADPEIPDRWLAVGMELSEDMYQANLEGQLLNVNTGGTVSTVNNGMPVRSFGGNLMTGNPQWLPDIINVAKGDGDWINTLSIAGGTEPNTEVRLRVKYKDEVSNDLAYQLSDDYYARYFRTHNITFAGTQNWQPTGYDDYVVHYQCLKNMGGKLTAHAMTRVRSWQGNLFPVANQIGEGGGSGGETILFEIIRPLRGVGVDCNAMECEVLNVSCGLASPSIGALVPVYDELGCVFNAPEALLNGKRGYATRMSNPQYGNDPLTITPGTEGISEPTGVCRWSVQVMCCVEEDG